jgi:RNA polymerase sigma factor (sigma-70 family)
MTNSERVQLLYNKHYSWLKAVCFNFTQSNAESEDLLQEVFLQLLEMKNLEKIIYDNNDLNLFYIFKIIKSKFLNNEKTKKKLVILEVNESIYENTESSEYSYEGDENTEKLLQLVNEVLDNELHWFDSKLIKTYIDEEHSIQSLHECTNISRNTIFNSLTKSKKYIKQKANEKGLYNKTR